MPKQYDDDWDNRKAFPEVEAWNEKCKERSLDFSRSVNFQMDNAYGSHPRNRIDVLPGKTGLPTFFPVRQRGSSGTPEIHHRPVEMPPWAPVL